MNSTSEQINSYNEEPVFYCADCLSLKIRILGERVEDTYCDSCNSTNIESTSITLWENIYEEKFNKKYLDKKIKTNGREQRRYR